jgi:transcriptional regulator with XRE-family HTH domain
MKSDLEVSTSTAARRINLSSSVDTLTEAITSLLSSGISCSLVGLGLSEGIDSSMVASVDGYKLSLPRFVMHTYSTTKPHPAQEGVMAWKTATDVGARIRQLREAAGLTQEQLAAKVGVTDQTISNYETGNSEPPRPKLVRLAEIFQISVTAFQEGGKVPAMAPKSDPAVSLAVVTPPIWGQPPFEHAPWAFTRAYQIFEAEIALAKARGRPITREKAAELVRMLSDAIREASGEAPDDHGDDHDDPGNTQSAAR